MIIAAEAITFTEVITPYLPVLGILLGIVATAIVNRINQRKSTLETKTPTVAEIWAKQERTDAKLDQVSAQFRVVRNERDSFKSAFLGLREVLLRVVDRAGVTLTPEEHRALEVPILDHPEEDDTLGS